MMAVRAREPGLFPLPDADDTLIRTPYLVMDTGRLRAPYRALRAAFGAEVAICCAVKANPDPRVMTAIAELGCGFETASLAELRALMQIGVLASDVLFSNPVKSPADIAGAAAAGVWRFAFDSVTEIEKLAARAPGAAVYVRLATRDVVSGVPSEGKFGVSVTQATELMVRARDAGLVPHGITFHVGSQMVDPRAWETAIGRAGAVMTALKGRGVMIRMLDAGGGFPVRYADPVPAVAVIAARIHAAVARLPYPVDLAVEPGRFLLADAGTMVTTVIGVADRGGACWAHLDAGAFHGFTESLETSQRLAYPVRDSRNDTAKRAWHLTGPTCDSQDTIRYAVQLSAGLRVGDRVSFGMAGAYTTSYTNFNGFPSPEIHICDPLTTGSERTAP